MQCCIYVSPWLLLHFPQLRQSVYVFLCNPIQWFFTDGEYCEVRELLTVSSPCYLQIYKE